MQQHWVAATKKNERLGPSSLTHVLGRGIRATAPPGPGPDGERPRRRGIEPTSLSTATPPQHYVAHLPHRSTGASNSLLVLCITGPPRSTTNTGDKARSSATHLLHLGSRDSLWRVTAGWGARSSSWEQRKSVPGSAPRAGAATTPAGSAHAGEGGVLAEGRLRRRRARPPDRGDGLRGVRWADHSGTPGAHPEVVLCYVPAPRLGAGQGRGLGPVSGEARRAARGGPGAARAYPP